MFLILWNTGEFGVLKPCLRSNLDQPWIFLGLWNLPCTFPLTFRVWTCTLWNLHFLFGVILEGERDAEKSLVWPFLGLWNLNKLGFLLFFYATWPWEISHWTSDLHMSVGNFPFSAEMGPHKRAQVRHSLMSVRITWFLLYHAFFLDWTKFERDTFRAIVFCNWRCNPSRMEH